MRVSNIRLDERNGRPALVADLEWEDWSRDPFEVSYIVDPDHGDALVASADPFLAPMATIAMAHGERRVVVDGAEACPRLVAGLRQVLAVHRIWFGGVIPDIDVAIRDRPLAEGTRRVATTFSGGVDSTFNLVRNRRDIPRGHPASIDDALIINTGLRRAPYNPRALEAIHAMADAMDFELIWIDTNVRDIDLSNDLWADRLVGPTIISLGHLMPQRVEMVHVAASYSAYDQHPNGTHPMTDPLLASYEVDVRHEDPEVTRLEKTQALLEDDLIARNLNVCVRPEPLPDDVLNCGRCSKCVRTRLTYLVLGVDDRPAFGGPELTPEFVNARIGTDHVQWTFMPELIGPLREVGRGDLADAILAARRRDVWKDRDQRYFHGAFGTVVRAARKVARR